MIYLFVDKSEESLRAIQLLSKLKVPFEIVDTDKNNIKGSMLIDFGTSKTPLLVTKDAIIIGFSSIKEYIEKLLS